MKTVIQKNQSKINNHVSNYQTAISKVNSILEAFNNAGYKIEDKQANTFCQNNFNDNSLREYALSISQSVTPIQQEKEVREIVNDLKELIVKTLPGWHLDFHSMAEVRVKNLKAVEENKVLKSIEESHTVYADGVKLDVFNELQEIADKINMVIPKLKQSVFNRRLDYRFIFIEDEEGNVKPNLDFIDFSDL